MDNKKTTELMERTKQKNVWSADIWYLVYGIICAVLAVLLEGVIIRQFFVAPIEETIGVAVILQIPVGICLLFMTNIKLWKNRVEFPLYYCKLETGLDIDFIRENYLIEDTSSNGVLFVRREDAENFSSWKLLQGYKYLSQLEDGFFE